LACELADVIAAFGPVSATLASDDLKICQPGRAVALIHFHGTADEANPYDGFTAAAGYMFSSVDESIQYFVKLNGCPAQARSDTSGSVRHDVYNPCQADTAVELYRIEGGKHAWPGGQAVNQKMGEPNMEINASALLWEFFQAHPMP
jgi:polyhydroxybutyrate depolymerase